MYVHFCNLRDRPWSTEACGDLNCQGIHLSLGVGFDDLCRILNQIDAIGKKGLWMRKVEILDEIEGTREWMGTVDPAAGPR